MEKAVKGQQPPSLPTIIEVEENNAIEEFFGRMMCPFNWDLQPQGTPFINYLANKLENLYSHHHKMELFAMLLVLAYERAMQPTKLGLSLHDIHSCYFIVDGMRGHQPTYRALLTIANSMKSYVLYKLGRHMEAWTYATSAFSSSQYMMERNAEACVHGIISIVKMQYRRQSDMQEALICAREAVKRSPKYWCWHFQLLRVLRHLRESIHGRHSPVQDEELAILKSAVSLSQTTNAVVLLASIYSDVHRQYPIQITDENFDPSSQDFVLQYMFLRALSLDATSPYLRLVCSMNDVPLPRNVEEVPVSLFCLKTFRVGLPRCHPRVRYCEGLLYERQLLNPVIVLQCYEMARNNGILDADLHYVRLKMQLQLSFDPMPSMERLVIDYPRTDHQILLLLNVGYFQDILKDDMFSAVEAWVDAIALDPASPILKNFEPLINLGQNMYYKNIFSIVQKKIKSMFLLENHRSLACYLQRLLQYVKMQAQESEICVRLINNLKRPVKPNHQ